MKVLVTGCAGFIGSRLAERLVDENHTVIGIDSFSDYYTKDQKESHLARLRSRPGFTFFEGRIQDMSLDSLLSGVDWVFHQAGQPGVRASWGTSFDRYTDDNILATQRLLEEVKNKPLKKFVFASTSSVYGDNQTLPLDETCLPRPVSPYGVTKLAAEHLCYLYWKSHGIPVISLRYFTVYGPGQRPDMAFHKFFRALVTGDTIEIFGDGKQTRDFTFVDDIVDANILAASSSVEGEVFNVGGGTRINVLELVDIMKKLTGRSLTVHFASRQKGDMRDTWADISKARSMLGYRPQVRLEDGLRREWLWIRSIYDAQA